MNVALSRLGRAALDLLYPPRCVLCSRSGPFVCDDCALGLPGAKGPRCDTCWLPADGFCRRCAERPLALERLRSVCRHDGQARRLVHAFKYGYQSCLSEPLARLMQPLVAEADLRAELLTPVPIAGRRQRERGYNQAGLLARDLGALSGLPVIDALTRRRFDGPQAGAATADQRWRRVQGSFAVRRPEAVRGRRVLLVDDVATTGATLDACARELLAAGAESVSAITFGRED